MWQIKQDFNIYGKFTLKISSLFFSIGEIASECCSLYLAITTMLIAETDLLSLN